MLLELALQVQLLPHVWLHYKDVEMSYNNTNLVLTGNQQDNGPFYFVYTTGDNLNDVTDGGYFSGAFGRLRYGDVIRVVANDGEVVYRVTSGRSSGSMEINNLETL